MKKLFIIMCLLIALPCHAAEVELLSLPTEGSATIRYEKGLLSTAQQIARDYPEVLSQTRRQLGMVGHELNEVNIVLLRDDSFQAAAGSDIVKAYADSSRGLIVINNDASGTEALEPRATLRHEVAHLFIGSATGDRRIPRWLNEGMAQWASGGNSEIREVAPDWAVSKAALTGTLIDLKQMTDTFPSDKTGVQLAYAESLSAVDMLVETHGQEVIGNILMRISHGTNPEDAFMEATGSTMGKFASEWKAEVTKSATILVWLRTHFYEALFILAALALVLGFIRTFYRIKTYKDPDEETGTEDDPTE